MDGVELHFEWRVARLALASLLAGAAATPSLNPSNARRAVLAQVYDGRTLVPFRFVWIDGRMVVTHDYSGVGRCPPGT
ncbi:hypothetical protein [Brevundimonas sp. NIBR11]|uniref:hypothetical protein n=1 Tax=Brevundimonas sp. NIBR11 TaxID=3015999 RepID=UPI0022F0143F|nr:hypothetical protein [Brevundimonas sp. NIBR11]WGM32037.1 hypothetical protein KKHFBJBL_02288 [Brevundimonas sp. NIBR11]